MGWTAFWISTQLAMVGAAWAPAAYVYRHRCGCR